VRLLYTGVSPDGNSAYITYSSRSYQYFNSSASNPYTIEETESGC